MVNGGFLCRILSLLGALSSLLATAPAHASAELLGVYVGAGVGYARVSANQPNLFPSSPNSLGSFKRNDGAYQILVGVRALELLGAEVDYIQLSEGRASPSWSGGGSLSDAHVSQKGEAAYAVLYLPVPILEVYLKAGVARLTTDLSGVNVVPGCTSPLDCIAPAGIRYYGAIDTTETTFASGAGVQWNIGRWAVRGEYERFAALGEHSDFLSLDATWSFL